MKSRSLGTVDEGGNPQAKAETGEARFYRVVLCFYRVLLPLSVLLRFLPLFVVAYFLVAISAF